MMTFEDFQQQMIEINSLFTAAGRIRVHADAGVKEAGDAWTGIILNLHERHEKIMAEWPTASDDEGFVGLARALKKIAVDNAIATWKSK